MQLKPILIGTAIAFYNNNNNNNNNDNYNDRLFNLFAA